jgi:asparagine synthase (glutamine-hydrolysing)
MCGIVGIVDFRERVDRDLILAAARTLYKRGPDGSDVWTSENVGLGHHRIENVMAAIASDHGI